MTDREALLVELVDERGARVGALPVAQAHTAPGRLHRAFSVLLFDDDGRLLLQQRAGVKTRFPLLWSNTCCGHPLPGQDVTEAAATRLAEELGVTAELREVGIYRYQAADPGTGLVEDEWDHVLVGRFRGVPRPDPDEVADYTWRWAAELADAITVDRAQYTPWLAGVLAVAADAVSRP
ncbi:isopentenyl-diphosphate Delta-isomerase [Nocardia stercoris]|uniref:Isopentenyl-diphosphate Delta-isomerase n=1 Tax=Nocardia stercoris TaxID=2483361 RepID=A0A3M2KWV6_9NOCA|nr:isopentenyl-diphosphate Delta-isomerase [Nocardia stercoris]